MKKLLLICSFLAFSVNGFSQSHIWINTSGDTNWFSPTNWSAGTVPNSASTVEIPDGFEVSISSGTALASEIELLGSAALTVSANLNVTNTITIPTAGQLTFTIGNIAAGTIENNGLILTETAELKDFTNTVINNHNTIHFSTSNILRLYGNVTINNMEDALIEITANGGLTEQNDANATLNNFGLVHKYNPSGDFGSFYMIIDCVNHGTLDIDADNQFLFLNMQASLHNTPTGILSGEGVFDITSPFINEGTVSPGGEDIGTLSFVNTFNLNGGTLDIDIITPDDHDNISVTGSPFLEGEITITSENQQLDLNDFYTIDILSSNFEITTCNMPNNVLFSQFDGQEEWLVYYDVLCSTNTLSLEVTGYKILLVNTEDFSTQPQMNLISNPVSQEAEFLIAPALLDNTGTLTIFDIAGKLIQTIKNLTEITTVDTSNYSNGIYLVQLTSNGKAETLKLIVQH